MHTRTQHVGVYYTAGIQSLNYRRCALFCVCVYMDASIKHYIYIGGIYYVLLYCIKYTSCCIM